jgi:hypothetical protein
VVQSAIAVANREPVAPSVAVAGGDPCDLLELRQRVRRCSDTTDPFAGIRRGRSATRTGFKTLIVHWNGTAWTRQPSPTPGPLSQLFGVAATSTGNAWAAGADENGSILQHWNGTTWR